MAGCTPRNPWLKVLLLTGIVILVVVQLWTSLYSLTMCGRAPFNVGDGVSDGTDSRMKSLPLHHLDRLDTEMSNINDIPTTPGLGRENTIENYETPIRPLKLVSGFGTNIVLFSAIAGNSTSNTTWDKLAITGWEARQLKGQTFVCCVVYSSGAIKSFPAIKLSRTHGCQMQTMQYVCAINGVSFDDMPLAATIADARQRVCHKYTAAYVGIEYAYAHPEEVAIFGKVTYGNVSARDLLTWIEIHRLQGVNKFLIYPYEIPRDAMKVLRYYQRQGLVDIIPYTRHITGAFKSVGYTQYHDDQHVTYYEGLQRLRGYRYVVNFDIDEYIIPSNGESWMSLFKRLFNKSSNGGAFWFQVYIFIKNWGATNTSSPFSVAQYSMRTDRTSDRRKLVYDPSRVKDIGMTTHTTFLKDGYKIYGVKHQDAALYHFRDCRPEWLHKNSDFPCYNVRRTHDDTVLNMFKMVEKDVMAVIRKLEI